MQASTELTPVDSPQCAGLSEKVILVLMRTYLPGYRAGGPIRSIENLVAVLGGEFKFRIVTLDRDLGDRLPFPGIVVNRWVQVGHADVMYLRAGLQSFLGVYALLRAVDSNTVVYLNSFFERCFSILAVFMVRLTLCRPRSVVIAPRGEFSLEALHLKCIRKRWYIRIFRWLKLHRGIVWQACSVFEKTDIRRQFPQSSSIAVRSIVSEGVASDLAPRRRSQTSHVEIASDIASISVPVERKSSKVPGRLRAVFIARCSRMKNLSGALKLLADISGEISFDIYGPLEDAEYWDECQGLIAALPPNISVRYEGELKHGLVSEILASYELFLLPTLGENFGHGIAEAFLAGCPVLISDRTPWRDLEALGIGWDAPLTEPKRFSEILQQCVDMGPEEHTAMCLRAAAFGASLASAPAVLEENRALFRLALAMPIRRSRSGSHH